MNVKARIDVSRVPSFDGKGIYVKRQMEHTVHLEIEKRSGRGFQSTRFIFRAKFNA